MKKWRLNSNKHRPKFKQEHKKTKSNLSSNLQSFKRKILPRSGFVEYI